MPAAGGRDSKCETGGQSRVCQLQVAGTQNARRAASHECASCRWQGLKMRDGRPVTSVPAAGGRNSKCETGEGQSRVCQLQVAGTLRARREGQSRVCQLQVAGTPSATREWVRASHECATCRWQGLNIRDESG